MSTLPSAAPREFAEPPAEPVALLHRWLAGKGRDLHGNPRAAATFWWPAVFRQVNITGHVEPVSAGESDAMWRAKGLSSQAAATVSRQGARLDDHEMLAARAARLIAAGGPVARPEEQAGVLLVPQTAEFWFGQASRLHYRLHYTRTGSGWESCLLQP